MRSVATTSVAAASALALLGALALAAPGSAQTVTCQKVDESTEEVLPGVVLTYDSSFLCADAPDQGSNGFTVEVASDASSAAAVRLEELELVATTPRPRGEEPEATGEASGLPTTVPPGESRSFEVSGTYELVATDEGRKANLHFQVAGEGTESGEPFRLGINAHLRGEGASEDGGPGEKGEPGPPSWVPGPPPWAPILDFLRELLSFGG